MANHRVRRTTYDVFIGNLPDYANEKTVGNLFTCYGEVQSIFVKEDKNGSSKIAFVKYLCEPDAKKAIQERNGWIWSGKVLSVRMCDKKDDKNKVRTKQRNQLNGPSQETVWPKNASEENLENDIFASANKAYPGSAKSQSGKESNETTTHPIVGSYGDTSSALLNKIGPLHYTEHKQQHNEELMVSHVESLNTIHCHRISQTEELYSLSSKLEALCPTLERLQGKPEMLKIYATVFSEDQMWYRCVVIKNDLPGQSVVRYADYGNRELVNNSSIVSLPEHLASIPSFCIKCRFNNVTTIEQTENPKKFEEGMNFLQQTLTGKILTVVLKPLTVANAFCLIKCNVDDMNVAQELVRRGYAVTREQGPLRGKGSFSWSENSLRSPTPLWLGGLQQANFTGLRQPLIDQGLKFYSPTKKPSLLRNYSGQKFSVFPSTPEEKLAVPIDKQKAKRKIVGNSNAGELRNTSIQSIKNGEGMEKLINERDNLKKELAAEKDKLQTAEHQLQSMAINLAQNNLLDKIMYVISTIPKVRETRQRIPILDDQDVIEMAVSIVSKDCSIFQEDNRQNQVKEAEELYQAVMHKIRLCCDKSELLELKKERDEARNSLCEVLQQFLSSVNKQSLSEMIANFEDIKSLLEHVYHPFFEVRNCNQDTSCLNDLISQYRNIKVQRQMILEKITQRTDQVHKDLMSTLNSLKEALSLDASIRKEGLTSNLNTDMTSFCASQLVLSFTHMQQALAEEVSACNMENTPEATVMSNVTQGLHCQLCVYLEKAKNLAQLYDHYNLLYKQINQCLDPVANVQNLQSVRKNIKAIKSKLRHKLADKNDLEENEEGDQEALTAVNCELTVLRKDLHENFVQEDNLMISLNEGYTNHLPELDLEYPELHLSSYSKYKGLLKQGWDLDHFTTEKLNDKFAVVYKAVFLNYPVVLKEYLIDGEEAKSLFLQRALEYQCIYSEHLLPIQAIFFSKNERQAYVQCRYIANTLFSELQNTMLSSQVINFILYGILKALDAIHSVGKIYGILHPLSVLVQSGYLAVLDSPDFSSEKPCSLPKIQGINFLAPETHNGGQITSSSDIYSFGCLMIWALLPTVTFQENSSGAPDISSYDDLLQEVCPDSASVIYSLVQPHPSQRPSAKTLLGNSYFSRLSTPEYSHLFPDDDMMSSSLHEDETEDGQDINNDGNNSDYYEDYKNTDDNDARSEDDHNSETVQHNEEIQTVTS